jgi:hypothetical protein
MYENSLKKELELNSKTSLEKSKLTKQKKESKKPKSPVKKMQQRTMYYHNENTDRDEKYFFKDSNSLPDHLREKLNNMPGNMGYIWKDIWFFGKDTPKSNSLVMFEKTYNHFYIHTITNDMYTIHEKSNDGNKKLIKQKQRYKIQ